MRIAVIGPLEVRQDDGSVVGVAGAKERLLLAVLVAGTPHLVSTDALEHALWGGAPPPTARKSLQAHLVRLRTALEPDRPHGSPGRYVLRRGPGYVLAADGVELDTLTFGWATARGRAELAAGHAAGAECTLTAALDLWRGEPYTDWPDAEFAAAERCRLTEVRAAAVAGRLEARLALGRAMDVVPDLERLVREAPLCENWWRLLMLGLYRVGRQADALAAGRRARAVLAAELGAELGPDLRATEAAILAQDPALWVAVPSASTDGGDKGRTAGDPCPDLAAAALPVAGDRAGQEAALRRRARRLARGLAAALVVALAASQRAVAARRAAERASLVAGADRLTELAAVVGSLEPSLLLASTPRTEDGPLAALLTHRRAERVARSVGEDGADGPVRLPSPRTPAAAAGSSRTRPSTAAARRS